MSRYIWIFLIALILFSCEAIMPEPDPDFIPIPKDVQDFVSEEQLPDDQEVRGDYFSEDPYLLLFSVPYGPAMDCPSGCFYSVAGGIKTERQIGWALSEDYPGGVLSIENRYSIDEYETVLFDTSIYNNIRESKWGEGWYWCILRYLAVDADTPSHVLEYIALSLYNYISPSMTIDLLSNPKIGSEPTVLCIMSANPLASQQGSQSSIRDSLSAYGINCSDY